MKVIRKTKSYIGLQCRIQASILELHWLHSAKQIIAWLWLYHITRISGAHKYSCFAHKYSHFTQNFFLTYRQTENGHASFLKEIAGFVQQPKHQKIVGLFDNLVVFVF